MVKDMSAIKEVEELADSFRDNYFQTVFDFLKFTTTFIIAYLVWIFSSFRSFEVHVIGFAAFCAIISGLFGLHIISSILSFYNVGLVTRRFHENSLKEYHPAILTEQMRKNQNKSISAISNLDGTEEYLSKVIPVWVSIHISFILLSVSAFAIYFAFYFLGLYGSFILLMAIVIIIPILLFIAKKHDEMIILYNKLKSGIVEFYLNE